MNSRWLCTAYKRTATGIQGVGLTKKRFVQFNSKKGEPHQLREGNYVTDLLAGFKVHQGESKDNHGSISHSLKQ